METLGAEVSPCIHVVWNDREVARLRGLLLELGMLLEREASHSSHCPQRGGWPTTHRQVCACWKRRAVRLIELEAGPIPDQRAAVVQGVQL